MEVRHERGGPSTHPDVRRRHPGAPVQGSKGWRQRLYRRKAANGFSYQAYNSPKGTWGGQLKNRIANAEGDELKAIYAQLGGTHTPYRRLWQEQLKRATKEGWYVAEQATVASIESVSGGGLACGVDFKGYQATIDADFVIDATGLESGVRKNSVVDDLFQHMNLAENVMNRIQVERTFEVRNTRSANSRLYASGVMTLGSYYAGVDSFLGLQYAALQIADDLARVGFCKRIGVVRSFSQWSKWARNVNI